jgi:flagellar hook protein FlgE
MGIFGALTTSVAGLRTQSYALENISGNIANSQTTAFKRIDTSFLDLIPDTGSNAQLSGSVAASSRETNTVQGDVQAASVATYMAINGDGFFAVQKPGSFTDNNPVFDGVDRYTRRGDFTLDKNGYLVNGAGYYLEGIPIDPTTGNVTGSVPQVLKFGNDFLPAQPTTTVTYRANLASYPLTTKHDTSVPGSELLNVGDFTANPLIVGTPAQPYVNGSKNGSVQNSKLTAATQITSSTLLSGATNTDSIGTDFVAGDTITINGSFTITFTASGGADDATHIPVDSSIADLLAKIDAANGNTNPSTASAVNNGIVTLNSGIASNLTVASSNAAAFTALGFSTATVTAARTGGGTAGTGTVIGSDSQNFIDESVSGEDRQRKPRLRSQRRLEPVLSDRSECDRQRCGVEKRRRELHLWRQRSDESGGALGDADQRHHWRHRARRRDDEFRRDRPHAIRRRQRQRAGQPDPERRLPGRSVADGVDLQQRPRRRQLLQRPQHRSRRDHARDLQRPELPQARRRRRVRGDR